MILLYLLPDRAEDAGGIVMQGAMRLDRVRRGRQLFVLTKTLILLVEVFWSIQTDYHFVFRDH